MKPYRYFKLSEFDSPDEIGSGKNMDRDFLRLLDDARHFAGVPFRISSGGGFRTEEYNAELVKRNPYAVKNSSHKQGFAADILTPTSSVRYAVLAGLLRAGLNRIGVSSTFIHVDDDPSKRPDVCWTYRP
jgi:zinc D-Ala-D-Ala carboxypeptidase